METKGQISVIFDYTSFLGASCNKKWTFVEALSSFAPIFGIVWRDSVKDTTQPADRLWEMAMKSLSSGKSDESNLVVLIKLAKLEGIEHLDIKMPYTLEQYQIDYIKSKAPVTINNNSTTSVSISLV